MRKVVVTYTGLISIVSFLVARPAAIDDLTIELFVPDSLKLSWSAPELDVHGDPVTVDHYLVYTGFEPYFTPSEGMLILETADTCHTFVDPMIFMMERGFMQVVSVVEDLPDLTLIPAGSFMMGSSFGEVEEQPVHEVTLTHDFYLSTYEITNQQYLEAAQWAYDQGYVTASEVRLAAYSRELLNVGDLYCEISFSEGAFHLEPVVEGSHQGENSADHPVKMVSWYGAACYCDWLSEMDGLTPFYQGVWDQSAGHNPYSADGYRLPTEAEWEYAACFDDDRNYPWGNIVPDCGYANFGGWEGCVGWTTPVGSYLTGISSLGLTDMSGNVWEWLGDWYDPEYYSYSPAVDPLGSDYIWGRSMRGGSYLSAALELRCSNRGYYEPDVFFPHFGFRVARTANP